MPKNAKRNVSSTDGVAPTRSDIQEELLVFWDGYSPLSLSEMRKAFDQGNTLDAVGIDPEEAQACVNKYNSLIARGPGRGPIVAPSTARSWASTKMSKIVDEVEKRAKP